jgi:hypothetical protein
MKDLEFLREMLQRLNKGRNGDPSELEMLEKMIKDWIDEIEREQA